MCWNKIHNNIMFNTVWYDNLIKPFLTPPEWIFAPVWIVLYATLLVSLIIYAVTITKKRKIDGYILFVSQMIFNLLWSPVFFYLHKIGLALIIVVGMDIISFFMIKKFFSISRLAGLILIPYFIWILFATYLNFQFLVLN